MGLLRSAPPRRSSRPPSPVVPGDVIAGKYVVERMLAEGGMGIVYGARHKDLDQAVAIKVMRGELRSRAAAKRFALEAKASAQLKSAHVARVFDVGDLPDGTPYMVMEHLDGLDLETLLEERRRLEPELAAELLCQACAAIREAHEAGIVHRDLKPANLFLTTTSQGAPFVKVLDFGISKATLDTSGKATAAGTIVGSPPYMAPEQLKSSRQASARSDVWSIGVILYELTLGCLPFEGEDVGELALRVHAGPPKWPRTIDGSIPEPFEAIVKKCLSVDPTERYADAGELEAALDTFVRTSPVVMSPLSIRSASPRVILIDPPPASSSAALFGNMTVSDSDRPPELEQRRFRVAAAAAAAAILAFFVAVGIRIATPDPLPAVPRANASPAREAPPETNTPSVRHAEAPPTATPVPPPAPEAEPPRTPTSVATGAAQLLAVSAPPSRAPAPIVPALARPPSASARPTRTAPPPVPTEKAAAEPPAASPEIRDRGF